MDNKISRRDVIARAAFLGAGAIFGKLSTGVADASGDPLTKQWPWPYVKLDPAETAERAYQGWYNVGCGGTVITSIFEQLSKKLGEPYKSFPTESFAIFEGGMAGWGTICGSLNGAAVVACLIIGPPTWEDTSKVITSDMMNWYSHTNMPVYVPKSPNANKSGIQHTISDSPLCHISVGKWMKAANAALGSDERKDRCARVSATVAYKLVQYLNRWKDGKLNVDDPIWVAPKKVGITAQYNCASCHGKKIPKAPLLKSSK